MNQKKDINQKKQWIRNNIIKIFIISIVLLFIYIVGAVIKNYLVIGLNTIIAFVAYVYCHNNMMSYIEKSNTDIEK